MFPKIPEPYASSSKTNVFSRLQGMFLKFPAYLWDFRFSDRMDYTLTRGLSMRATDQKALKNKAYFVQIYGNI